MSERQLIPDYYDMEKGISDREYCKICLADLVDHICPNCEDEDHDENYFL